MPPGRCHVAIVIDHSRNRMRIDGPVHQHQRNVSLRQQALTTESRTMRRCKNEPVHVAALQRLARSPFRFPDHYRSPRVLAMIALLGQAVLELPDDGRKKRIGQIGNDHADRCVCDRCAARKRANCGRIPHIGCDAANAISNGGRNHRAGPGVENPGNRGRMDLRLRGDVLDTDVSFRHRRFGD